MIDIVPMQVKAFERFHAENPHIYQAFCRFTLEAAKRRTHYSARDVIHRVRWWSHIESRDPEGWKINNNWSPYYGRMFERDYPQYAGFFAHRVSFADRAKLPRARA